MSNKFSIKFFSLLVIVFLILSITNFSNKVLNNNNTASIVSVIKGFLNIGDGISDCTEGDIKYQCPENVSTGCYCDGGIVGSNGKLWQAISETPYFTYPEAESYCANLGEGWKISSPDELFSIYNYDIKYIYSYTQPIKASWFIPENQIFWTDYEYESKHTFMLAKYNTINTVSNNSYSFPTICVKDLYNDSIFAYGNDLTIEGLGDVTDKMVGEYQKKDNYYENGFSSITYDNQGWKISTNGAEWLKLNAYAVVGADEVMWQKTQSDTPLNWEQGNDYCNNLTLAGFDDWRLPSRVEVESVCLFGDTCANNYWADSGQEDYYMPEFNSWNSNSGGYAPATARCIRVNVVSPLGEYYPENSTQGGVIFVSKTASSTFTTSTSATSSTTITKIIGDVVGKESKITELVLENVVYNVNIDDINKKIIIGLQDNTDTSKLKIYISTSDGAKVFSNGYILDKVEENKYLLSGLVSSLNVVSEDGSSKSTYNIVTAYPPTVSLDVLNTTIYEKQTTKITWTPIGAKSCIASGNDTGWTGGSAPSSVDGSHTWTTGQLGIDTANTPKIYTYGIKCTNSVGNTDIVTDTIKVLPDIYVTPRGGSRMSTVVAEAGISGLNEFVLIKTDIRKTFENPKAHFVTCPAEIDSSKFQCIEDNNDDNGNYVLIGIKNK